MKTKQQMKAAKRRKYHIRKKVMGTSDRPRLAVFRSSRHIYAQIVDDAAGITLVACGTRQKGLRDHLDKAGNCKAAKAVGEALAKQAVGVGIRCVRFDRNRYRYHGRVKSLADAAREAGLVF
jgi:large subunit ribosomal protein L18